MGRKTDLSRWRKDDTRRVRGNGAGPPSHLWPGAAGLVLLALAGCSPSTHDLSARGQLGLLHERMQRAPETAHNRDDWGKTPLHHAVSFRELAAADLLVRAGAEIDAADETGMTPLHTAAMLGRTRLAAWLLRQGANVAQRDQFGNTPAHTAALFGQGGMFPVLRDHGADLTAQNDVAATPRDLALREGHQRAADYLAHLTR